MGKGWIASRESLLMDRLEKVEQANLPCASPSLPPGAGAQEAAGTGAEKAAGSLSDPPWDDTGQNTALSFHEWIEKPSFVRKNTYLVSVSFPKQVPVKAEKELARGQSCWFSDGPAVDQGSRWLQTMEQVPAAQKTGSRPHSPSHPGNLTSQWGGWVW